MKAALAGAWMGYSIHWVLCWFLHRRIDSSGGLMPWGPLVRQRSYDPATLPAHQSISTETHMAKPNMKRATSAGREALPMHRAKCPVCNWRSKPHPRKAKAEEEYTEHWAATHNDGTPDA